MSSYVAQSWRQAGWLDGKGKAYELDGWDPMPTAGPWRPRRDPVAMAAHCTAWTGGLFVPSMRVVDADTGLVLWQRSGDRHERCGPDVLLGPAQEAELARLWRVQLQAWRDEEAAVARPAPAPAPPVPVVEQFSLF